MEQKTKRERVVDAIERETNEDLHVRGRLIAVEITRAETMNWYRYIQYRPILNWLEQSVCKRESR